MINVLYDISLLGIAYRNRSTFGLSRTTEDLLVSLMATPELRLSACSDVSFNVWLFSRLYLKEQAFAVQLPFLSDSLNVRTRNKIKEWFLSEAAFKRTMQTLKKISLLKDESRAYQWRAKFLEYRFQGTPRSRLANIDIYHSNYHAIPAVVQRHQRIKAVLTVHDIIPILHPEWCGMLGAEKQKYFHPEFNLPATLNALTQDNWIICPSNASRNDLCDYLKRQIDPDKVLVIPWAASPTVFYHCLDLERRAAMRLKYKIPAGHYLLSLSTIEPRKNLDGLIRSFHRLLQQERMSDLCLVLAGALGWDYQDIFQALRKYPKLAGRVIFTGHVVNEDMAALYSDALGFVCPSFYEGFGLPPLEAMQCGTPVIVSDVSSLPEVVGDAGLLVNPRDEDAIAQAMLKLYRDAALRAELSQKGLARSAMFSWSQCAEQTADFYRRALAS